MLSSVDVRAKRSDKLSFSGRNNSAAPAERFPRGNRGIAFISWRRIAFAQQFLAELVEAFQFAAAADGFVGLFADTRGELAAHGGDKEKGGEGHPILRVGDGEGVDRRQKIIVEDQHRAERHHHRDGHSPHRGNC